MADSIRGPRKRRTRQHVIADLSVHYTEGHILEEGHTAQRFSSDYSYDLVMRSFDENGYAEPDSVYFQVKAKEAVVWGASDCVFDIDIRDYNLWIDEDFPVILILYDASAREARWLALKSYFDDDVSRRPKPGTKTVRVRIPKHQVLNRQAIALFRVMKAKARKPRLRVQP